MIPAITLRVYPPKDTFKIGTIEFEEPFTPFSTLPTEEILPLVRDKLFDTSEILKAFEIDNVNVIREYGIIYVYAPVEEKYQSFFVLGGQIL